MSYIAVRPLMNLESLQLMTNLSPTYKLANIFGRVNAINGIKKRRNVSILYMG